MRSAVTAWKNRNEGIIIVRLARGVNKFRFIEERGAEVAVWVGENAAVASPAADLHVPRDSAAEAAAMLESSGSR